MTKRISARASGGIEYRTIPLSDTEATDTGNLTGTAVRFDSPTMIGESPWGFRESFAAGAFTKTLTEADVVLLDNHDVGKPIARKSAGTLQLSQDEGLRWDAIPANTSYANDVRENVKAKNYGGCSFGFQSVKEDWLDDDGRPSDAMSGTQRVVREAKLFEVSVCTFPAYTDTTVDTRDAVSALRQNRAAKANWGDMDTCGECDATGQYGSYCSNCGEPMTEPKPTNNFCPSCGSDLSGERDGHICGEVRGKYSADDKKSMLAKGQALKNANGDPSYPIGDEEDLDKAIKAVGRGGADHDSIRKYIIGRAKSLGLSAKIPDTWNSDGSVTESKSTNQTADETSLSFSPKPEDSTSVEIDLRMYQHDLMELKEGKG